MRNNPNGTGNLPLQGNRLGYLIFGSYDGSIGRYASGVGGFAEGDWTSISTPTYLLFETASTGSTSRSERMRITSSGNVGIGTASPTQKIEVSGGVRLNTWAAKPACDSSAGPNNRGTIWFTKGAVGVADKMEVCVRLADGNYEWKLLFQ